MLIDNAVKVFSEKYDRDAIGSIDNISSERGLILNGATMKVFNINECFDKFSQYIREYAKYKEENINNSNASPQEVIRESVDKFIENHIIEEKEVKYPELPGFVKSYVEGIDKLAVAVEDSKNILIEAGVDPECIGDVNDFTDKFMMKLNESFDNTMEKILWASGYMSKKKISNIIKESGNKKKNVFL